MIFVTVGTHEQSFNRLIQCIDELKLENVISENIVIQTGFSTYVPLNCEWKKIFSYKEMKEMVHDARIIITHGGPSSFIMPLQVGKIPIVVPRQKQFDEHVNDHQLEFAKEVEKRQGNIIVIEGIEQLQNKILNYDQIVMEMPKGIKSHNKKFNNELEKLVEEIFTVALK
ncbi:glycosyltransferase [Trichococcus pasteurii]|uniref:Glycosyl transferase family 28 C-terminal domain-containing protein n=1 Tax=Trichococcus pasteurii TaxID=43064 RepID=A0A1W1IIG3_9LACT|nr:glycosyltransferase [Trichococcus pasteurii]SFF09260.1 UDP-N-acetylglucosamine transferase subunit ALG13 [Trichococcus pasteurii]SLM52751.1 Hypothetical protein TPAS_2458 [Trichococcus pasteurii]SSB93632.1 Hypothetical protein TPAS_2458 [Trichococcus pasteurii]